MPDQTELETASDSYFQEHLRLSLAALLKPIDSSQPAGPSLRATGTYGAIAQTRQHDDDSLPMGSWDRELKRADWHAAGRLCANALAFESKDLRLAAWLLEAQTKLSGLASIGPCIYLMQRLCTDYWTDLHPQEDLGHAEQRANIFRWVNEKLLPTVRMVPLTAAGGPRQFGWGDLEMERRQEQIRNAAPPGRHGHAEGTADEAPGNDIIRASIRATPTEFYLEQRDALTLALAALDALTRNIAPLFGDEPVDMDAISSILQQIMSMVTAELHRRGVTTPVAQEAVSQGDSTSGLHPLEAEQSNSSGPSSPSSPSSPSGPSGPSSAPIRGRADAYARLAEVADYLMRQEPHSPVPYLVRRAIDWGGLNTGELYQEIFLKQNGQLNIYEMLGLQEGTESKPSL